MRFPAKYTVNVMRKPDRDELNVSLVVKKIWENITIQ